MKQYINWWKFLGKSMLVIILLWFCYSTGKALYQVLLNLVLYLKERFRDTYIIGPIEFYIASIFFVLTLSAIIVIIFNNSHNPITIELVKITLTFFIVFVVYIGPLIMLSMMILLNIPIEQLTIAFAVMSFIAVTFKKGKYIIVKMYQIIDKHI
ncbi:hypothetical protein [Staphylococcus hominis]|uniref:hypothetical protein n=1 Tax=Staphylococcus hominis TaxID=1290 RepID=UPI0031BB5DFB